MKATRPALVHESLGLDHWVIRTVRGSEARLDRRFTSQMWFSKLRVRDRYTLHGEGRLLLQQACWIADCRHEVIECSPVPTGALDLAQLVAWYKRYGFVRENRYLLIREPRCLS